METIIFLEALVRALGHGWSARYGMIVPYGVFGVTLTTSAGGSAGGSVEVVPSLVRGAVVVWSPFVFARGTLHYDLHLEHGELVRTRVLAEAVARLDRWRQDHAPAESASTRAITERPVSRPRRPARTTDIGTVSGPGTTPADGTRIPGPRGGAAAAKATASVKATAATKAAGAATKAAGAAAATKAAGATTKAAGATSKAAGAAASKAAGAAKAARSAGSTEPPAARSAAIESLADALRDRKLGDIERARKLAKQRDRDGAVRELLAIARRASGDARANALVVLVAVARPEDGAELARYLDDPEHSVQRAAVDGVARTGYAAAIPALAVIVVSRDARPTSGKSQLAAYAATAMKVLSGKRGAQALTGYLSADDPRVREAACVALTMFPHPGTKRARPVLERLLADGDARVVKAAKRVLAAL